MDWQERATALEHRLRGLLLQGLDGDSHAYRRFLEELSVLLRGFLRRRMARLPDDVEDLVQETLLAVHTQRHTYRPEQPLTAWVHGIARYKLVDLLRSRGRREALHDPLEQDLEVFAASDTDAADARRDLGLLLQSLSPRHRRALVMTKLEGASVAEAAAATGMSEGAVKVGVHRSLKFLATKVRVAK
ncbi:MAG TPA: sigma-70 family RNA polymerase sigma factor [Ramlibacter sp.]|nr:sigma-70 family RNA polymerase sigma factor [Ramlibacter sp.]